MSVFRAAVLLAGLAATVGVSLRPAVRTGSVASPPAGAAAARQTPAPNPETPLKSRDREGAEASKPAIGAGEAASAAPHSDGRDSPQAPAPGQPMFSAEQLSFFEAKVRPVLVEHCYKCHASTSEKLKGGLRVDGREALLRGGDSGPSIVPGDPDASKFIEAVRYHNEDIAMPPKGKLPDAVVKDLEQWVAMGAPWPAGEGAVTARKGPDYAKLRAEHWSYQPIRKTTPPDVADTDWPANDIDHFVLAELEAKHFKPAPDAPAATLLRRLYFDLIGLPPSPQDLAAFTADPSFAAYTRVVDVLIASPQFGERWGRHWLDVARYAESLTLRGLVLPNAWRYRDYVIDQFNQDRPFNQFLAEQVAGDLMPAAGTEASRRQRIATTFLMLGNNNLEEQDKQQLRMDVVDEQVDTIGKAMLAQTIGCARCHDHKFDPIPTADYYALAAIFRNVKGLEDANVSKWIDVPLQQPADVEKALATHDAKVASLQLQIKNLKAAQSTLSPVKGPAKKAIKAAELAGIVVDDSQARVVGMWRESQFSGIYIQNGYLHDQNSSKGQKTLTFEPDIKQAGVYEVRLAYVASSNRADNVPVTISSADGEKTIDINEKDPPPIDGRFVSLGQYRFENNGFGSVLVSTLGTNGYVVADAVQFIPAGDPSLVSAAAKPVVNPDFDVPGRIKSLEAELKSLQASGPVRDAALSVVEESKLTPMFVNVRGNVHNKGPAVERGFLTAVKVPDAPSPAASKQSGRRELGAWLASNSNPLPARVMANRVWYWLMGQGLCRTVDNFGTTGETPSHPELLDFLSADFQKDWSVKRLVRQIVLSRTYRQAYLPPVEAARKSPEAAASDPENRLCWRGNRKRLDGESLRDAMLLASGQLDLRPPHDRTFGSKLVSDYNFDFTPPLRSIYAPVFRNALPEIISVFDSADPSMVTGQRNVSTVAPQALFMMNHPFVAAQADAAAGRLVAEVSDDAERTTLIYQRLLGRSPSDREKAIVLQFVNGQEPRRAWAAVVHGLLASIDFRYVE